MEVSGEWRALEINNSAMQGGTGGGGVLSLIKSGHICSKSPLGELCHSHALNDQHSLLMVAALTGSCSLRAKPALGDSTCPSLNLTDIPER